MIPMPPGARPISVRPKPASPAPGSAAFNALGVGTARKGFTAPGACALWSPLSSPPASRAKIPGVAFVAPAPTPAPRNPPEYMACASAADGPGTAPVLPAPGAQLMYGVEFSRKFGTDFSAGGGQLPAATGSPSFVSRADACRAGEWVGVRLAHESPPGCVRDFGIGVVSPFSA